MNDYDHSVNLARNYFEKVKTNLETLIDIALVESGEQNRLRFKVMGYHSAMNYFEKNVSLLGGTIIDVKGISISDEERVRRLFIWTYYDVMTDVISGTDGPRTEGLRQFLLNLERVFDTSIPRWV